MKKISIYIFFALSLFLTSCETVSVPVSINSIEQAKKHAPGIWTYTGQDALGMWTYTKAGPIWTKYVVEDNGFYRMYRAVPIADDWGEKPQKTGTWRATTGKYADTGQRYYAIEFKPSEKGFGFSTHKAIFINSKKFMVLWFGMTSGSDVWIYYEKGDKFPFSK